MAAFPGGFVVLAGSTVLVSGTVPCCGLRWHRDMRWSCISPDGRRSLAYRLCTVCFRNKCPEGVRGQGVQMESEPQGGAIQLQCLWSGWPGWLLEALEFNG